MVSNRLIDGEQIDWNVVQSYLKENIPTMPEGTLQVTKFTEGYSNITYLLQVGDWKGVLRRPPFGQIPPRAHDMKREYTILSKLHPVFTPAPQPYLYCEDQSIMDKHFYVMEKKIGYVIDDSIPEQYGSSEECGSIISRNMIDSLVHLQSIDYEQIGLSNFGKPEGYLTRQVHGWIQRYDHSKTDTIAGIKELEKWFVEHIQEQDEATIVHNDFKLNNLIFDIDDVGKIIGVLDWELSTIGNPLTDLGSSIAYWGEEGDPDMGINIITDEPGFYSRREMIEAYAKVSGRNVDYAHYYVAFGFYKLAVILQQIYYRWKMGEVADSRFKALNEPIANLIEMANNARQKQFL